MITVIGDIHGKYDRYYEIVQQKNIHPFTVQLGDFGFKYDVLNNVDYDHHVIIGGNHDNYDICHNYPHFLSDYGYMVNFNGVDFFYYRGAYSIDRQYRTVGLDWWDNEQVSVEQFMQARKLYADIKPDIMITHDCPQNIASIMLENRGRTYENITSWALQELLNIHEPKLWLFGHWHKSRTIQYGKTKFVCLDELETYSI